MDAFDDAPGLVRAGARSALAGARHRVELWRISGKQTNPTHERKRQRWISTVLEILDIEAALLESCRACGAERGEGCRTPLGKGTGTHQARKDDARKLAGEPCSREAGLTEGRAKP